MNDIEMITYNRYQVGDQESGMYADYSFYRIGLSTKLGTPIKIEVLGNDTTFGRITFDNGRTVDVYDINEVQRYTDEDQQLINTEKSK